MNTVCLILEIQMDVLWYLYCKAEDKQSQNEYLTKYFMACNKYIQEMKGA